MRRIYSITLYNKENKKMKKIFLIGGAGYIGARLVPILLKKNYIVKVYDIFFLKIN